MRYDAEEMKKAIRYSYFEDADGNVIETDDCRSPDCDCTYVSGHPTTYVETFDSYTRKYNRRQQFFMKLPLIGKVFRKHYEKKIPRTFNHSFSFNNGWWEECALAMANSGEYKLREAIWVLSHCCERCMNVLANKYMGEEYGYAYESEDYKNCNTACQYCRDRKDNKSCY